MPKIEVYEKAFYDYIGKQYTDPQLQELLVAAKAELDGRDDDEGLLKIELNDTNRPDLWSTAGLGRQLRMYENGGIPEYSFFSSEGDEKDFGGRTVIVDPALREYRPYIVAFAVSGRPVDEPTLLDIIQTQEKLCWNYGRRRSSIAMGVYRSDLITYPVKYFGADPDGKRFVPLQETREMTLREIIAEHPKGKEFGHIISHMPRYPLITDTNGKVLSMPPIINSAEIGAVQEGDRNLFIEMTGTGLPALLHGASIVACDFADGGFEILPVKIIYPYDTPFGREIVCPFYFQKPVTVKLAAVNKMLGVELSPEEVKEGAARMGVTGEIRGDEFTVRVPEYRNDFLHPVDIIEDVMIGKGMDFFKPVMPSDFTVGRLTPAEVFGRNVKDIMIGLGYQEMMYNYLGSRKNYIEKMNVTGNEYIQVANPMTENYEFVRASVLPCLLESESISGNAVYPHAVFEVGKVAFLDSSDNYGSVTKNYLGFMYSDGNADFNRLSSHVSALFFYMNKEYSLGEIDDPRFIRGRCAEIIYNGMRAGIFGETSPEVLTNWGIQMPCAVGEIDLDIIRGDE